MQLISEGKAPKIVQATEGATYDKIWKKKAVAKVNYAIRFTVNKYPIGKTYFFYCYGLVLWTDLRHLFKKTEHVGCSVV